MSLLPTLWRLVALVPLLAVIGTALPSGAAEKANDRSTGIPWTVTENDHGGYSGVSHTWPSLVIEFEIMTGEPTLISWIQSVDHPQWWFLRYDAGCAGTSTLVCVERSVIVDPAKRKIIADVVVSERWLGGDGGEDMEVNASFDWRDDRVLIRAQGGELEHETEIPY